MTDPTRTSPISGRGPRQWLLLGTGAAHVQLLQKLATQPVAGVQITLISTQSHPWLAERVPGFVAGVYRAEDCQWPLAPLVQRSGVQWLRNGVRTLDAGARTLTLDDGRTLAFDWLSLDLPAAHNRERTEATLPGARKHALFAHPVAAFCQLWPQVLALAQQRPLRMTVVGAGTKIGRAHV